MSAHLVEQRADFCGGFSRARLALFALGSYAERHDAAEIADSAYAHALQSSPKMRPAYAARLRLAEERG